MEKSKGFSGVEAPVGTSEPVLVVDLASVLDLETCHPSDTTTGDLVLTAVMALVTVSAPEGAGVRPRKGVGMWGSRSPSWGLVGPKYP